MAQSDPQHKPWGMQVRGFTKLSGEYITPSRPSVGRNAAGRPKPTPRKLVTNLPEIKQLNWAENGKNLIPGSSTQKKYLSKKDEGKDNHGLCWLCGKTIFRNEQRFSNYLGKLEVEHALPLKLGYILLTIPGERVFNEQGIVTNHGNIDDQYYTDEKIREMRIEILRSHRLCNNLKSNLNFFMFDGNEWVPKTELITVFQDKLTQLQSNLNYGGKITVPNCVVNQGSLDAICKRLNAKTGGNIENLVGEEIGNKVYIEDLNSKEIEIWKVKLIDYLTTSIATKEDKDIIEENSQIIQTSKPIEGIDEDVEDTATSHGSPIKTINGAQGLPTIKEETTLENNVEKTIYEQKIKATAQRNMYQMPFESPGKVTEVFPTAYNQSGIKTAFGEFNENEIGAAEALVEMKKDGDINNF